LIATARTCLVASVDVLSAKGLQCISESTDPQVNQEFEKLTASIGLFMKEYNNTDIHMFFHRQVIHKYGKQELANIIAKYPWIEFEREDVEQKVIN